MSIVYDGRIERAVITCREKAVRSHFLGLSLKIPKYCVSAIAFAVAIFSLHLLSASAQTFSGPSVNAARSQLDQSKFQEADRLIEEAIATGKCPGAVLLVGRGDAIVYQRAYGNRAVKPAAQPMTLDTVFDLASLTKSVATATSVMILTERGKLNVDDPVAKYLPEFAQNGKEKITISDLLLHVSGLMPDNPVADYEQGPSIAMQKTLALAPSWPARTHFAYSDVNFIVLGELVRRVSGRPLDQFALEEIFKPLGMNDTSYNPDAAHKSRCAPTEQRNGHWMIGQVHDPRAFLLGGVAGHAGVFSTAADLSRFCRMILRGGELDGKRILKASTVAEWIRPRAVPAPALDQQGQRVDGPATRTYGFDIDTLYAGIRGERFDRATTLGHTGFTGTAFWLDPPNDCYFILLTNSVHPEGKGNVLRLRHQVATVVAEALLGPAPTTQPATKPASDMATISVDSPSRGVPGERPILNTLVRKSDVLTGIDVIRINRFAPLVGHKIGLITNHSGRDRDGNRTVDLLAHAPGVTLVRLFSPEHGIDGILDQKVANDIDARTGLKILSLYGPTQKPTPQMLEGIDTLVYDIQDAGARFYTYITTLGLCMQAAGANHVRFVVLDRPNPNTGLVCDGPLADKAHFGFTAFGPLPLVHGMTVGELARLYAGEFGVKCELEVVPMQNWRRRMWFDQTQLPWINPSPNLRSASATLLYPAICLMEASNVSVGRGTETPFELFGAPWVDAQKLANALNDSNLPGVKFEPTTFQPTASKFSNQKCQGVHATITDRNSFEPARSGVTIIWHMRHLFGAEFQFQLVGKLLQSDAALKAIEKTETPESIPLEWASEIEKFKSQRLKFLLYR